MSAEEHPFDREYWEDRYAAPGLAWSGDPNPVLIAEATRLAPGRALDVGSGEGGDALWLAMRGWNVTGVDFAQSALDKARAHAELVDPSAAARIQWERRDLTTWLLPAGAYDLVSSQFMHLPAPARTALFRSLAAAVAPGGTLLVVGHDFSDHEAAGHHPHQQELMFTVEDVLVAIEGEHLSVVIAESRTRQATPAHGNTTPPRDIVVKATRSGGE